MNNNIFDLTNPQKAIWLTEQFYQGTNINNVCGTFFSNDKINFKILEKAINIFVKTNDNFRIKLFIDKNTVKQFISDYEYFYIPTFLVNSKEELSNLEKNIVSKPFNLLNSLLFNFTLFNFPDGHGGFIINSHHIISDSWTNSLVSDRIIKIYINLLNSSENLDITTFSYTDYISSEEEYKNSNKFLKDKEYWNSIYSTIPEIANIPSSYKNNVLDNKSLDANRILKTFNSDIFIKINEFCRVQKISLYNFFMTVFSIYIARVSTLNDFTIGTPVLNRTNFKEKNTCGMFINTLPFRLTLTEDETFSEFVNKVSIDSLSMLRHQKYSYQYIIEDLRKKDSSLPNLYNIMLSYQITKMNSAAELLDHTNSWIFDGTIYDDLDIHLFEWNNEDNSFLNIAYDYRKQKYEAEDIDNIHNRIEYIIKQILENLNILIKEIEIVTPDEKNKILYSFNNTKVQYSKNKTIVDLFEEQVQKTPDNIALVFEDKKLTYKELNEKTNQLANYLLENYLNKKGTCAILLNRSLEMIISILAVLKTGSSYIPIDPSYPKDRIEYILEDSNSDIVITNSKTCNEINTENSINIDKVDFANFSKNNLQTKILPDDTSYLIYTSGSTGMPKGVILKHGSLYNLTNYCNRTVEYLKNNLYRSIVSVTTVSFDIFIFESLISLQKGLKLVLANEDEQLNPVLLNKLLEKENIEIIQTTPSRMKILVNNLIQIPNISKLKFITLAGEQLPIELRDILKTICNPIIYNGYGPSETTIFSTFTDVTNSNIITIGRPLDNTQIYILDKNLKPCPIGVQGELYISGDGVGKGYINKLDLVKKTFINNPFIKNSIMYKTGDTGFFLPNGEIVCLGRVDSQVKIRGLRIELDEIEKQILNIPNISNCIVAKKVLNDSHEVLCAYYISSNNVETNIIRNKLKNILPKYMIPQYFIRLDNLPYTPNGKVDRKILPLPSMNEEKTRSIAARNNIDEKLVNILKDLLSIDSIGIEDDFFELGADSLTIINLSSIIYDKLKVNVLVKDIIENSSIIKLSNLISSKTNGSVEIIPRCDFKLYYPVSSAQKRIYYASNSIENSSILYNIPFGIILDKVPDLYRLENSLQTLINENDSLRTYFKIKDNELVQKIEENMEFKLELENATIEDIDILYKKFVKPFDLSKAPLFRVKLYKLENGKCLLLMDIHHIICDGSSLFILVEKLCNIYNKNTDSLYSINNLDYKDFAVWENNKLIKNEFNEAKKYWINQFKDDIPVLDMPLKNIRPYIRDFKGNSVVSVLDETITREIYAISKKFNVTPYMLLLSAYYILLHKYSSNDDIIVGTPVVNREYTDLKNIIGMFVNTLALRNKINPSNTFKNFLITVKNNFLNALKYQYYPFDELVNNLELKRDISRNPLFDVMFTFQNNGYPKLNLDGINCNYYLPSNNISKFDLSLEVIPKDSTLNLRFEYCEKLFDQNFIERMASHYKNILQNILTNIDIEISNINMLSEEEEKHILSDFNNYNMDIPDNENLSTMFDKISQLYPNEIAVTGANGSITYSELNIKSNILAKKLIENNVKPSNVVGVCLNRSIELIVSILAILKIGAVYMPMHTKYPLDRLNYMLEDSNAKLLITTSNMSKSLSSCANKIILNDFHWLESYDTYFEINNFSNENIAYIIYTSGSTGNPKGVQVSHRNLINFIVSFINYYNYEIGITDRLLASTNISFDVSIWEIFLPLLTGAKLVLYNEEVINDILNYCNYIKNNKITTLYIPPNILDSVYSILESSKETIYINKMLVGVESIKKRTLNKFYNFNKNLKIVNGYGPTETTICCTALMYKYDPIDEDNFASIGHPLYNNKAYILTKNLTPQPIGVCGELYISGNGVTKGYINKPIENKNNYIENTKISPTVLYKTGDIAKWNEDGTISFLGRRDKQVKISGHRIELKEIDHVIEQFPYVNKCITIIDNINNNNCILSYFISDRLITISDLLAYLQEKLPNYMIPKFLTQVKSFPLTPNGKIDKKNLPSPSSYSAKVYVAPENDFQSSLCNIWKSLFHLDKVGITDNFFELGGDSLTAIKLQTEALKYGLNLNYSDIFTYPTIRALSVKHNNAPIYHIDSNYNYKKINELLKINSVNNIFYNQKDSYKKGNILLLGATGFLGAHILDNFLTNTSGVIYCLVRKKHSIDSEERLKNVLQFYFGNKYDSYFGNRIIVIYGDITKQNLGLSINNYYILASSISNVINSAALVKHFGDFDSFNSINVVGTRNIIDFCKKFNKKLYHISTTSIAGMKNSENKNIRKKYYKESDFFIKQDLDNAYIYTKFEAEKLIFEEILNGLKACVLRVGNITNRYSDGKFQINPSENAFLNKLKSLFNLSIIQEKYVSHSVEFTPVDFCADAIVRIVCDNPDFTVFHLFNTNLISFENIISILKDLGYYINSVSDEVFANTISDYLRDEELKNKISGIITDLDKDKLLSLMFNVIPSAYFTTKYLYTLGFKWPIINHEYIEKYMNYFKNINYFNF